MTITADPLRNPAWTADDRYIGTAGGLYPPPHVDKGRTKPAVVRRCHVRLAEVCLSGAQFLRLASEDDL